MCSISNLKECECGISLHLTKNMTLKLHKTV